MIFVVMGRAGERGRVRSSTPSMSSTTQPEVDEQQEIADVSGTVPPLPPPPPAGTDPSTPSLAPNSPTRPVAMPRIPQTGSALLESLKGKWTGALSGGTGSYFSGPAGLVFELRISSTRSQPVGTLSSEDVECKTKVYLESVAGTNKMSFVTNKGTLAADNDPKYAACPESFTILRVAGEPLRLVYLGSDDSKGVMLPSE
jgi:hypothetical protein